jgi:hypothetical protein
MTFDQSNDGTSDIIKITEDASPLAVAILVFAVMMLAATAMVMFLKQVPYVLIAILLVAAIMVSQLAVLLLQTLWGTTLKIDAEALTIVRLFKTVAYPWHEVADIRLSYSGGMLNDKPRSDEEDRLAVGLFLKGGVSQSPKDRDADLVLCTAPSSAAQQLTRLVETLKRYTAQHTAKAAPQRGRTPQAAGEFRRRLGAVPTPAAGSARFAAAAKVPFGRRQD